MTHYSADDQARGAAPASVALTVGESWQLDAFGPRLENCYGYRIDHLAADQSALTEVKRTELARNKDGYFDRVLISYRANKTGNATVVIGQTCEAKPENSPFCDLMAYLPIRITVVVS